MTDTLLSVKNLYKHFDISGGLLDQLSFSAGKFHRQKTLVKAVNNISFELNAGETFSVVGESGCGKSTLGRTIMGLYPPNGGEIRYRGERIDYLDHKQLLPYRKKMQMVFQDPTLPLTRAKPSVRRWKIRCVFITRI